MACASNLFPSGPLSSASQDSRGPSQTPVFDQEVPNKNMTSLPCSCQSMSLVSSALALLSDGSTSMDVHVVDPLTRLDLPIPNLSPFL